MGYALWITCIVLAGIAYVTWDNPTGLWTSHLAGLCYALGAAGAFVTNTWWPLWSALLASWAYSVLTLFLMKPRAGRDS